MGAILQPLKHTGFHRPQELIDLKQGFADAMVQAPQAKKPVYQAAMQVCDALAEAADERAKARANREASRAVHAGTNLGASHKIDPSWRELEREKREQKKLNAEAKENDAFFTAAQESEWKNRAVQLRAGIERLYEREREIERE